MRWKKETRRGKAERLLEWRKWFAWYPVVLEPESRDALTRKVIWLEYVERRDIWNYFEFETQFREYKNLEQK